MPKKALTAVLVLYVLAQPLTALVGRSYLERWGSQGNPYNQWREYEAIAAPDVLFIGDSRVRADVDRAEIGTALARNGVPASVASIGIDGVKPSFLRAVVGRVLAREARPRVVVLAISEFQLNAEWDRSPDGDGPQTRYFWQLGGPPDLRYSGQALALDQERGRLMLGWLVPLLANSGIIAEGLRCDASAVMKRSVCVDEYRDRDAAMDEATLLRWQRIIGEQYLVRFAPSVDQVAALVSTIADLRANGIEVALLVLPVYRVAELDVLAYGRFIETASSVAKTSAVPFTDLHDLFDTRREVFFNQNHLDRAGEREIAPLLARLVSAR